MIGFDIDRERVRELCEFVDRTHEVESRDLQSRALRLTTESAALAEADFYIVTVPTPIDAANRPDLGALRAASDSVGKHLKKGDIVVYESTVYPGATELECIPVLEQASGLKSGVDFCVGYSPERINPGDKEHRFETIAKIVSAQNAEGLEIVASVYGSVIKAPIHRATSIAVAEASKVIENTQRDLNIALMNELAMIFARLGIDTADVLEAAGTKWNFLRFHPGLVGGHCVGVDPYYLTHRAEMVGYIPQVILAGRRVNDTMGEWIARTAITKLGIHRAIARRVAILGVTFKENVPDTRNSRVPDMINEFKAFGFEVQVHDPLARSADVEEHYGIGLTPLEDMARADIVCLAVAHEEYLSSGWPMIEKLVAPGHAMVVDIKAKLDRAGCPKNVTLWRP